LVLRDTYWVLVSWKFQGNVILDLGVDPTGKPPEFAGSYPSPGLSRKCLGVKIIDLYSPSFRQTVWEIDVFDQGGGGVGVEFDNSRESGVSVPFYNEVPDF
tara:strand:+ start:239 stop:541 length:303 start_codon:yes stop_codon:yes gene_type:complete